MAGARIALRALGLLFGELFLLLWYMVNEQCEVPDILKCSSIPIDLYFMITIP